MHSSIVMICAGAALLQQLDASRKISIADLLAKRQLHNIDERPSSASLRIRQGVPSRTRQSPGSAETGQDRFIRAIKLAMRAATKKLPSKDGKRVTDVGGKHGKPILIKQWADTNRALKMAREAIIPTDYAETLIDNVFATRVAKGFANQQQRSNSKSGSMIIVSDYDDRTKSRYLLKSEKRDDVIKGMLPILGKYGRRIGESMDSCSQSTLMKVLLVFEPLKVDPIVDDKVWMLIQNVNPFRPRRGNTVKEYDLKHSREISRCKSNSSDGVLGDFMRDFGRPLREAVGMRHQLHGDLGPQIATLSMRGGELHSKKICLLSTIAKDFSALDSSYPATKLVDQSVLFFTIRPEGDTPTAEELEIANRRNNVFQIKKGSQTWFVVYGIIDLFAPKNRRKWWQSHAMGSNAEFIFNTPKFSLYPILAFCMSQYFFYYDKFGWGDQGITSWEKEVGTSWFKCWRRGGLRDRKYSLDSPGKKDTVLLHEAIRHDDRMCSLLQTCDGFLRTKEVTNNLFQCCSVAKDGAPCEL